MRIVFFNIWHGKYMDRLNKFFGDQISNTDIFCLTEVGPEILKELENVFKDYKHYYSEITKTDYLGGGMEGQGIFVRQGIGLSSYTRHFIYPVNSGDAGALETGIIEANGKEFALGSVHAMAKPGTKNDTPVRIQQSKNILNAFKDYSGPIVLGGDFNLNPDTESVSIFEKSGFKNLVKEYEISDTRGPINRDIYKDSEEGVQNFADYAFVTKDVFVKDFSVPQLDASDHLPLILDFEI